ncbi:universal stress protein [Nocardia brasiliensis]|uniref:Universal stress protein n=1 Tax=Nocardia brasiliensis TaxID=37326 RepID=A0A6G9XRV6_NOCBR|nr:universal stress protein [Nocardia brasiliensis]QIS03682.1 universal stress protein [Nocardia brasiliensis]
MSDTLNPPILVGTDGSPAATDAVRWAARAAARHGAPLHIVYAIDAPMDFGPGIAFTQIDYDAYRTAGAAITAKARETAGAAAGIANPRIETFVVEAPTIPVLRDRSAHARLLVVGTHGYGAIRRGLLGSVSTTLARHAKCPVAVVPESAGGERTDGPVVVGVDGSAGGAHALDVAFDEASRRGAPLLAVLTWSEFDRYLRRTDMRAEAERLLAETIAGYQEKYPDVPVSRLVKAARPAKCLLETADSAQLIVIGSRGHGGFPGLTLGSVSQAVLHGAGCPVIITRPAVDIPHE